jgi:uncharacterized protein YjiS (DUF1127 family)
MQFESQWPGDAIAAPFCRMHGREDAIFEGLGGMVRLEPGAFGPGPRRLRRRAAADRRTRHARPTHSIAAAMSWAIGSVIEAFILSAAAMHPEFLWLPGNKVRRRWGPRPGPRQGCIREEHRVRTRRLLTRSRPGRSGARKPHPFARPETAPTGFLGWRASVISILAECWSRMLREREIRRLRAAWESLDDRTLKDIGISRHEIEYAREGQQSS